MGSRRSYRPWLCRISLGPECSRETVNELFGEPGRLPHATGKEKLEQSPLIRARELQESAVVTSVPPSNPLPTEESMLELQFGESWHSDFDVSDLGVDTTIYCRFEPA